jgi:hypothetical protein
MAAINGISIPTSISVALPQMQGTPKPSQAARDELSQKRYKYYKPQLAGGNAQVPRLFWRVGGWPGDRL